MPTASAAGPDLGHWTPRPRPPRQAIEGAFVRLEPLSAAAHGDGLFAAKSVADAPARFRYLFDEPPTDRAALDLWLQKSEASEDPLFFAVLDKATGAVGGRQALMRIDATHGVAEIGNIYWGPAIARRPAATEAVFLWARLLFEELGYRRFEWKCNNRNEPSKAAALRFGFRFEGVFRQHMVVKGENRDTAWFAMLDGEWPALARAYGGWLNPDNFDAAGQQRRRLEDFRADAV